MTERNFSATPVQSCDRIFALDVLRGFALLGILLMNIQSFSMIEAAYLFPTAYGDFNGINRLIWIVCNLFADQKFINLFSLMFGVGIVLMTGRIEAAGKKTAGLYYRRTLILLLIGLMHAHLFWYGDILVVYALCSFIVFFFRKLSPKILVSLGILFICVPFCFNMFAGFNMPYWPPEAREEFSLQWLPHEEMIEEEIEIYQSGWLRQMEHRVPTAFVFETFIFLIWGFWRTSGLMFIGMALYKMDVVTGERSKKFYAGMTGIGLAIGISLTGYGIHRNFQENWAVEYSFFLGSQYNYWGSFFTSAAYIGVVMLICKSSVFRSYTKPLANVGRTALSNYLFHTFVCTTIFYGHGFGLFGQVDRIGQIVIVILIWILQLIISAAWIRRFHYGPFEWLWRTFTYMKIQPFKLRNSS